MQMGFDDPAEPRMTLRIQLWPSGQAGAPFCPNHFCPDQILIVGWRLSTWAWPPRGASRLRLLFLPLFFAFSSSTRRSHYTNFYEEKKMKKEEKTLAPWFSCFPVVPYLEVLGPGVLLRIAGL